MPSDRVLVRHTHGTRSRNDESAEVVAQGIEVGLEARRTTSYMRENWFGKSTGKAVRKVPLYRNTLTSDARTAGG